MLNNKTISLYIHIPFCIKKCLYCDFCSLINLNIIDEYLFYLKKEAEYYSNYFKDYKVKTVFVGGGTPTILSNLQISDTFNYIFSLFNIIKDAEITCEGNPETFKDSKLKVLLDVGFNRISIGVQSLDDNVLKSIGRIHSSKTAIKAIECAKKVGFNNINVDLMYGLPNQNIDTHVNTLNQIVNLDIEHISAYNLILEDGTKLKQMYDSKKISIPNEDLQLDMYDVTKNILEQSGFYQYEISNYSKKNKECKHNLVYWRREQYIGIGESSHSFILNNGSEIRFANPSNYSEYIDFVNKGKYFNQTEYIDYDNAIFEYMMLGLRLIDGINESDFLDKFNISIWKYYPGTILELINDNLMIYDGNNLKLSQKGIKLQNYVLVKLAK